MTVTTPGFVGVKDVAGEIARLLDGAAVIGCLCHKDADADSLGSALGFAASMRALGRRVAVMVPDPVPELLTHLPGFESLEEPPRHLDVLMTFDCATRSRFGEKADLLDRAGVVVNIDHHASNEGFGNINLVEPTASATGQLVHELLVAIGAPIPAETATNLYAALLTDTGGFRHENTTEAALRLAADLVAQGADPGWVALKSYKSRSIAQMRLEGLAMARLQSELDGQLIWSEVTPEMLAGAEASMQEAEGVIDHLQSVDTMKLAICFKETRDADGSKPRTKISVRSRDEFDATDRLPAIRGAAATIEPPVPNSASPSRLPGNRS